MNYFAHGRPFLDQPYLLAGTAVPDWLNVVDRKVRARAKHARPLTSDVDPLVADVARGIVQHHDDDDWFHNTRAFSELSWQFTRQIRDALPPDDGLRPSFLGHILVEILLDAVLIEACPQQLEDYYRALAAIDPQVVETTVNRISKKPTDSLAALIPHFVSVRFLFDYTDDAKLLNRLNQVMRRVKLAALPKALLDLLPGARQAVSARADELLAVKESSTRES